MKAPSVQGRLGAGDRCPFCGGTSGVTKDDDGFSCLSCGGPRILVDPPIARNGAEKPLLEQVKQLRSRRAAWGVAASVGTLGGLVALVVTVVLALVLHLGENGGEIAAALVLVPLLFGGFGFSRVRKSSGAARAALGKAELAVVAELTQARGGPIEATELATLLHVESARAEELAAETQVEQFLTSGDPPPPARVRIDSGETEDVADPVITDRRDRVP